MSRNGTNTYKLIEIHLNIHRSRNSYTRNGNHIRNKINEIDDGNIYAMWWQFCKCDVFVNFIKI